MKTPHLFVVLVLLMAAIRPAHAQLPLAVDTTSGTVRGSEEVVKMFKGIPYAAPPTGSLRWKAPQPAPSWTGVRDATAFGPACPQGPGEIGNAPTSEDCLTLNVWTPARTSGDSLPVMFWIHGGAFIGGASSQPIYDGARLAQKGVVVVSVNYRLGILSSLAHPELAKESPEHSSGNYALLDLMAALRWVQANIARFGGDPKRVTIFGQSAGGTYVTYLLVSPLSTGLFHAAIVQSPGAVNMPIRHRTEAWFGQPSAEDAGKKLGRLRDLRQLSVIELMKRAAPPESTTALAGLGSVTPIVDGWILPDDPGRLLSQGRIQPVPVMTGATNDEAIVFTARSPSTMTVAAYRTAVSSLFGPLSGRVLGLYPAAQDADVKPAFTQLLSDFGFVNGSRLVARAAAERSGLAYQYFFTRVNALGRGASAGAFHGAEIPYVFDLLRVRNPAPSAAMFQAFPLPDGDPVDRSLSSLMSDAWVRFAKTGDPNGGDLPAWPKFTDDDERYLEFGEAVKTGQHLRTEKLDTFDTTMRVARAVLIPQTWTGFVALGVLRYPDYLGADTQRTTPIPLASLEYKKRLVASIGTLGASAAVGLNVIRSTHWNASAILGVADRRPESRVPRLAGLGDQGYGVDAGIGIGHSQGVFSQSVRVFRGLNSGSGTLANLGLGLNVPLGFRGLVSLGANATVADAERMQYDFGITASQAASRLTLFNQGDPRLTAPGPSSAYFPKGGLQSVGFNAALVVVLKGPFAAVAVASVKQLTDTVAESPLVQQQKQTSLGVGLGYRF